MGRENPEDEHQEGEDVDEWERNEMLKKLIETCIMLLC